MRRRINGNDGDVLGPVVTIGVAAGAYLLVVKPLMGLLGGNQPSAADNATVAAQALVPATQSPLSSQYQPFYNNFAANPSYNQDGSVMNLSQYYAAVKSMYDSQDQSLTGDALVIVTAAENIYNSISIWKFTPDFATIQAAFATLSNKVDVASVAAYLLYNYNVDLFTYLQNGKGLLSGLDNTQVATLVNYVNSLPD